MAAHQMTPKHDVENEVGKLGWKTWLENWEPACQRLGEKIVLDQKTQQQSIRTEQKRAKAK
jgi:hypothetical protein